VVAAVFHSKDPEATWLAWRHFLSDTLHVDHDLRLHDVHMVKSTDEARLLNFQDFRGADHATREAKKGAQWGKGGESIALGVLGSDRIDDMCGGAISVRGSRDGS
jgi:hypothetical protein